MERHDVRKFRDRHGLSQADLAGKVGVTDRTVRRWENGRVNPSPVVHGQLQRVRQELEASMGAHTPTPNQSAAPVRKSPMAAPRTPTPKSVGEKRIPKGAALTKSGPQRRVAHLPGDIEGERTLAPLAGVLPSMGRA